ncbi:recombinase family protein [bacterium]|nr:recombinase family protein [bacterium]
MARDESSGPKKKASCAIYTRKSTDEGLDQDFNSLDAQREAGEAYVQSQRHEGWVCLTERYDDGGFSGANMDRPALARLLADVEAGRVDIIVVYKVDRLSRSLIDFARIVEVFDRRQVSFVSVTQQFNTGTSLGRLVLNMLLSFAQFERELIAERTRDKMSAARKKGKWVGGTPFLGYDLAEKGGKLVVNEAEAAQVREIFALYLREGSLLATAEKINERGWRTKSWVTRKGARREGNFWTKEHLRRLVTNPAYIGRVAYQGQVYPAEHAPSVDAETFASVQEFVAEGRRDGLGRPRNSFGYLLRGLVRCAACGSSMSPATTCKRGADYRYYACVKAKKRGTSACPVRSMPADELERFVVDRLKSLSRDPQLITETIAKATAGARERLPALRQEERTLAVDHQRVREEARTLLSALAAQACGDGRLASERLGELDQRAAQIDRRRTEIRDEIAELTRTLVEEEDARAALSLFSPVWETLEPRERARIVQLMIEHVELDGVKGEIALTFHPLGISTLADEVAGRRSAEETEQGVPEVIEA